MHADLLTCSTSSHDSQSPPDNPMYPADPHNQPNFKLHKKPKPPPLRIDTTEKYCWSVLNPLVEFAAIATSPQSPLVQHSDHMFRDVNTRDQHQAETSFSVVTNHNGRRHDSTCSSPGYSPLDNISSSDDSDISLRNNPQHTWSPSLWQQLKQRSTIQYNDTSYQDRSLAGSAVNANNCTNITTQTEERKPSSEVIRTSSLFRPHTMKDESYTPRPRSPEQDRVWSTSYFTENLPTNHRGLSRELFFEDICSPLTGSPVHLTTSSNHDDNFTTSQSTKSAVLFDLDSAAHALSNMAKRKEEYKKYRRNATNTGSIKRKVGSKRKKHDATATLQAKRPMNSFMLFAKRYRLELTQKHPGKDNRAISVILGDQWKSLSYEDRKTYIMEAKLLAEEHKRIYPDCWKRKRTSQVSTGRTRKC